MPDRLSYDEAMAFSSVRLKIQDPELKGGKVETVTTNTTVGSVQRPWGIEGGFAVVYKFRTKSGQVRALRCFRVPMQPDTKYRYERIGPYFNTHAPDITAGFKYHDAAIAVKEQNQAQSQTYPVIEMDWIDGETLLEKVDMLCKQRDHTTLRDFSEQWLTLLRTMRQARIAHGDLSAGNVMVRPNGRLVLIDYDGVYIPDFAGKNAVVAGQPDYQHPHMQQRPFNERMDDFSALVIYTALLALEARPELWDKYIKRDQKGKLLEVNLLFSQQDFATPHQSQLLRELEQLGDQRIRDLAQELKRACQQPVDQVQFPYHLLDPRYEQKLALARLEKAVREDDDEQIAASWISILVNYPEAQSHRGRAQLAQQRVKALVHYRNALQTQHLHQIIASYDPLLDACKNVTHDERNVLTYARNLASAFNGAQDDRILALYDRMQSVQLLRHFTLTVQEQDRITLARQRTAALHNAQVALDSREVSQIGTAYNTILNGYQGLTQDAQQQLALAHTFVQACANNDDDAIIAAHDAIQNFQYRDFFIFSTQEQQRVAIARQCKQALVKFQVALLSKRPQLIVTSYDALLNSSKLVKSEERARLTLARSFVQAYNDNDDAIVEAYDAMQNISHRSFFVFSTQEQERVTLARQRKLAFVTFQTALANKNPRQIVAAYNAMLDTSTLVKSEERERLALARSFVQAYDADDDDTLVAAYDAIQNFSHRSFFAFSTQEQARVTLAQSRKAALARFRVVARDKKAKLLVDAYDPALLDACKSMTQEERALLVAAQRYLTMYQAVLAALHTNNNTGDDDLIRATYDTSLAQQFTDFTPEEQGRIDQTMKYVLMEGALKRKEYALALQIAQNIEKTTRKPLDDFRLSLAKNKFIRPLDPRHLEVRIQGDEAYARWLWPQEDLVQDVFLAWRPDTWPQHPKRQEGGTVLLRVPRLSYQQRGNFTFKIGGYPQIYVQVYAAMPDFVEHHQPVTWRYSDGIEPTSKAVVSSILSW